jgi:hypothetical protein
VRPARFCALRNFGGDIGRQPVDNARQSDFDTASGFIDARQALRSTPDL